MGTDIYLEYDGKPNEEIFKEGTYIRASVFSIKENTVLRLIFPKEYWEGKRSRYKFTKEKLEEVKIILKMYLKSFLENKELECKESKEYEELGKRIILSLLASFGGASIEVSKIDNFEFAKRWARSVLKFFEKGLEMEEKGRNPRIEISW